jgi:radical SAM-linked protein
MSMRIRINFSKTEEMRFTGHLDLYRALERTIRRAKLPLTYSQGFNPHPKISIASALPLGFSSEAEVADIWLNEVLPLKEVNQKLNSALPPGIQINEIKAAELSEPKLQNSLRSAFFNVLLKEPINELEKVIKEFLDADEVLFEKIKKGKKRVTNIREFVFSIEIIENDDDGNQQLNLHLSAKEGKTGRPDVVLAKLGIDPLSTRIHRTELIFI